MVLPKAWGTQTSLWYVHLEWGPRRKKKGQTHETALDCTEMDACVRSGAVRERQQRHVCTENAPPPLHCPTNGCLPNPSSFSTWPQSYFYFGHAWLNGESYRAASHTERMPPNMYVGNGWPGRERKQFLGIDCKGNCVECTLGMLESQSSTAL